MFSRRALLGGLTAAEFLGDFWQQKPLLIRGAFPDFECPLDPDELAGKALSPLITMLAPPALPGSVTSQPAGPLQT